MKKEEFYFDSSNGKTKVRAVKYVPDKKPVAILQISHGMVEFIDRYDNFAKYLNEKGILVVGNDHLGHGGSVNDKSEWGYLGNDEGYLDVLNDLHVLTLLTKKDYPDVPYFLLGHSMGSFFARLYVETFGDELNGAIIMGTGQQTAMTVSVAKGLCKVIKAFKGDRYRSKFINNLAIGSYNKKWEPSDTHCDWLTKDKKIVDWYSKEEKCQFVFTVDGYYNLFNLISQIIKENNVTNIPKDLPILFMSGNDDPVGDFGKGVRQVYDSFIKAGIKNVDIKLYDNDRHEILNELDKERVMEDLYNFLNKNIPNH